MTYSYARNIYEFQEKLKVINSFNIVEARNKVMAVEEYLQLLKPSYLAYFLPK